jgi:NDP-sugar pyrophosphorylase family protein
MPAIARTRQCLATIVVLVLAGGLGTRLRPVLGDLPKILAPIAGRPFLDVLLDWLREYGARRVVLGLGFRADHVLRHLAANSPPDLEVSALVEPKPLGTAGAIRFARGELHSDPALVMNGDSLVAGADLCDLLETHEKSAGLCTLLCARVENAARYGRVSIDDEGKIAGFIEKESAVCRTAAVNGGVYAMSQAFLDRIAASSAVSLERDVFERLPAGTLSGVVSGELIDIGTPESLMLADRNAQRGGRARVPGQ